MTSYITRLFCVCLLALLVTIGLLWLMNALVAQHIASPTTPSQIALRDILIPKQKSQNYTEEIKPDQPIATPQPLIKLSPITIDLPDVDVARVAIDALPIEPQLSVSAVGGFIADGEYLPIYRASPEYPSRAIRRGIEGFVVIEFTVTQTGAVADLNIIEANPKGWFEKAALSAAKQFKYKPRTVDGHAIAVSGVRTKITFKLE